MSPIHTLTFSLLLAGLTSAQVKTGEVPPVKKGDGIGAVTPPPATVEKPQDKPAPVDTTKLLEKSLEVAERERAFLEQVVKTGGLLKRFRAGRGVAQEMTETFTPELAGPAIPTKTKARLLGDGEKAKLDNDVVFTVESVPVTQREYDATLAYLRSFPQADSVASIETVAIKTLIDRKAAQGVHPKKTATARQIILEIEKRVRDGQKFSDLAGQYSEDKATSKTGGKLDFVVRSKMDPGLAMATQGLKITQCSGVTESIDGFHIVRVLGIKKGETPDKDRLQTAHIVRYYTNEESSRANMRRRIVEGKIDVAFRTDEMRAKAPAPFK